MPANTAMTPDVWEQYLDEFSYFSVDDIRSGCHPRILEHASGSGKAIVLIHGLSDSPYFVSAIGNYFHSVLRYNVYRC